MCRGTPLRHGDFRLKKTLSSDRLGPIEHLTWPPITKSRCLACPLGLMDPYETFQPDITATWVALEAKNVPWNPLRHGDFR